MDIRKQFIETSYLPVQWVYREVIEEQIINGTAGKIFYFCKEEGVCAAEGKITRMEEDKEGVFICLESGQKVRIDRIVTLFGKPGAAYDEYDAYANACMECMGGYEKDEL